MLAPCLAGDVLKWKLIVRLPFDKANESAGDSVHGKIPRIESCRIHGTGYINMENNRRWRTRDKPVTGPAGHHRTRRGARRRARSRCASWCGRRRRLRTVSGAGIAPPASPPQMIMSLPLQIAVWYSQAEGAELMLVASNYSAPGCIARWWSMKTNNRAGGLLSDQTKSDGYTLKKRQALFVLFSFFWR